MNKKHLLNYKNNEHDKLIQKYYKILFNGEEDVYIRLLAVDYLSRFADKKRHKTRLESLYKREKDFTVKEALREVLDGTYKAVSAAGEDVSNYEIDEIIEELNKQDAISSSKNSNEVESMLKYVRHNAVSGSM